MTRVIRLIDIASDNWILPLVTILLTLVIVGPGSYFLPGLVGIMVLVRLAYWLVFKRLVKWIIASGVVRWIAAKLFGIKLLSRFKGKTIDLKTYVNWHQPLWTQPIAITSFFFLIWLMFGSWQQSVLFLVSMYAHELGHALIFTWAGIKSEIRFLTLLGAVAYPATKEEEEASDRLPWFRQSILMLAGPVVNVLLMLVGLWITETRVISSLMVLGISFEEWGEQLIYINGLLAIFNLVPMGKLDAGQFFLLVFSSLEEKWDYLVFGAIATVVAIVPIVVWVLEGPNRLVLMMIRHFPVTLFCYTMLPGLWKIMRSDNSTHHTSSQAMNLTQMLVTSLVWVTMVMLVLQMF